ncbi:hypothetical protein SPONN_1261 [uncultured Candidatus Thioglobus sp.]|nr:hypothetical protein SPONN_1261 [uncultured Candidatus Thioglobus sp.]
MDFVRAEVFSVIAIGISLLLPIYLNSQNKKTNSKKNTLEKLEELSLLINKTLKKDLYDIRREVNIILDFSNANINFQTDVSDYIESRNKEGALREISAYKDNIKL